MYGDCNEYKWCNEYMYNNYMVTAMNVYGVINIIEINILNKLMGL